MKLQDIFIYPVKSLGGIRKEEGRVLQRGFQYDRRLMLVDQSGKFITQRVEHQLALLQTDLASNQIHISHKLLPHQTLTVDLPSGKDSSILVKIWDDVTSAVHVSEEADEWFSNFLGKNCKLVFMPEMGKRPVDLKYSENNEQVSFADAFPYLLIGQGTLDELNSRLSIPVPMNRFRPNLVVSGAMPYEEDSWAEIKIGEIRFKVAKPCARCVLTTIDQDTGMKGTEPLKTLASYRTINNKVLFGQNLIALNEGILRENDQVEILSYK